MTKTIHITKYALTKGIITVPADVGVSGSASVDKKHFPDAAFNLWFGAKDFELDRADAVLRAQNMRDRKLANLRRQIASLEGKTFA